MIISSGKILLISLIADVKVFKGSIIIIANDRYNFTKKTLSLGYELEIILKKYLRIRTVKHIIKIISESPKTLTNLKLVRNAVAKDIPKNNSILNILDKFIILIMRNIFYTTQ